MITKLRVIQFARKQNARFLTAFHQDRQPLRLFEKNARFPGSPVFSVYRAGCQEMTFHLLGSAEVDETFRARLEIADKISPAQMGAVNAAMERAVGETALELESQMILLATAVSGSPFLGLLGTVWGVMDAFTGVAEAGSPSLATMAPGVSGALITTVTALWLGHKQVETTQMYLHADLAIKERALARTKPLDSKPGRYRPPDALLGFLDGL